MVDAGSKIAVVTGASRGLGRGVARALGSKGMTVYVTGRRLEGGLSQAAEEVTARGGRGIALACDHADDEQVAALFARIKADAGRIDLLFNNAATVHVTDLVSPGPFWEKPLHLVDMIDVGLRSNYVASYHAAAIMAQAGGGLIASVSFYGAVSYFHGPAYGAAKAGTDKMMRDMAVDLRPYGVSAVSIWPGILFTEAVAAIPPEYVTDELRQLLPTMERPEFTGLVLEALMNDPELPGMSGDALIGAELGLRYGLKDIDGKQPLSYRGTMGAPVKADPAERPK